MAQFHTFIPSEPRYNYDNIDEDFGPDFINVMKRIEDYSDRQVEKEFNEKMYEQWEEERFTVNRNNFWDTYEPVRDFLQEKVEEFTVEEKRALLMLLYERDTIFQKIKWGDWSYVDSGTQTYVSRNIRKILSGRSISRRRVSLANEEKARTTQANKEADENKIIKSMKKRDLTNKQLKKIKAIERLVAVIEEEAESGQIVPYLRKDWWKVADLDNFLKYKNNELKERRTLNESSRNGEEEQDEGFLSKAWSWLVDGS